eukprot:Skav213619  [mRNA]  locus=scaffold2986:436361:451240:+ [translate_table: standard]
MVRGNGSGPQRPAFGRNLGQVMVYLFDVLVWCYAYTALWMYFAKAPCDFWMWLIAFRMTAVSCAGVGVLMSALVPKHNATLATACLLLVMGGAISEPQVIADATGVSTALAFLSLFTWTSGENYLAVIGSNGGEIVVKDYAPEALPIMEGYKKILLCLGGSELGYVTAAYISCLELAARPSILMLDEPTSGLDASTALEIIRSVKRLTAIGMTVQRQR